MIDAIVNIMSWVLFVTGGAFVLIGAIGVIRFPDFYTRLHAAGVTDTLGADLILLGMIFQSGGDWLLMVKIFFIFIFILLTSPVSTHAIAHAAFVSGFAPLIGKDLHYPKPDEDLPRPAEGEGQS